jgi:hypothetical protein
MGTLIIIEGDTVEFSAWGKHEYHGVGKVYAIRSIKDFSGHLVNVYMVIFDSPDQGHGVILLGDGEIVRVLEEEEVDVA